MKLRERWDWIAILVALVLSVLAFGVVRAYVRPGPDPTDHDAPPRRWP